MRPFDMRKIFSFVMSAGILLFILNQISFLELEKLFLRIGYKSLFFSLIFILINLMLAFIRYLVSFRIIGVKIFPKNISRSFFAGQLGSLIPLGILGQSVTRALPLSGIGVTGSQVTFVTLLDKLVSLIGLSFFAIIGILFLIDNLEITKLNAGIGPDSTLLIIAALLNLAIILYFSRNDLKYFSVIEVIRTLRIKPFFFFILLTFCANFCMLLGYYFALLALFPNPSILSSFSALSLVMFVSAMPISFGGWGVRELAAMYILSLIGVEKSVGLGVGVLVGLLSLFVILVCLIGFFLSRSNREDISKHYSSAEPSHPFDQVFTLVLCLIAAVWIPFQLRLNFGSGMILVNFADFFAIASLALLVSRPSLFKNVPYALSMILITCALLTGLLVGFINYGITRWAIFNRGFGWIIIVSYFYIGFTALQALSERGLNLLVFAFTASVSMISIIVIVIYFLRFTISDFPIDLITISQSGFSFNANAFSLLCIMALVLLFPQISTGRLKLYLAFPIVIALSLLTARTAFVLGLLFIIAIPIVDRKRSGDALWLLIIGSLFHFGNAYIADLISYTVYLVAPENKNIFVQNPKSLVQLHQDMLIQKSSSDNERVESVFGGFQLFLESPFWGRGIGAYMAERLSSNNSALVIHSTPVWILAEMGVFGLGLLLAAFGLVVVNLWKLKSNIMARYAMLMLLLFVVGGLVHDFFYQRVFWFAFGIMAAYLSSESNRYFKS